LPSIKVALSFPRTFGGKKGQIAALKRLVNAKRLLLMTLQGNPFRRWQFLADNPRLKSPPRWNWVNCFIGPWEEPVFLRRPDHFRRAFFSHLLHLCSSENFLRIAPSKTERGHALVDPAALARCIHLPERRVGEPRQELRKKMLLPPFREMGGGLQHKQKPPRTLSNFTSSHSKSPMERARSFQSKLFFLHFNFCTLISEGLQRRRRRQRGESLAAYKWRRADDDGDEEEEEEEIQ